MSDEQASLAMALMRGAFSRIGSGDWKGAATDLARAAALHAEAGRTYDEARCLQLAATLSRASGDAAGAEDLTRRASRLETGDRSLSLSIEAEQAEQAHSAGRWDEAYAGWSRCLAAAGAAGLEAEGRIALLERRATAAQMLGRFGEADVDLADAMALAAEPIGQRLRARHAERLIDLGETSRAEKFLTDADERLADAEARALLLIQHARLARARREAKRAVEQAHVARTAAREAVAPVPYFAASIELAEALDAAGDRTGSYSALATAWATLSDLIGREAARSWVEPCLLALRLRWGDDSFAAAKAAHDTARRLALDLGAP